MSCQFLDEKMFRVALSREDAFEDFRDAARGLIGAEVAPRDVTWRVRDGDLLGGKAPPESSISFSVPAAYVRLAENVVCHRDPERFALLYELLWRITHGERELLSIASDPLVHRLQRMEKSVRRDMHKMTAFLRFRRVDAEDGEHFVAWFEPEHFILRRMADFFIGRFAAMRWSILTPQGALHWDGKELTKSGRRCACRRAGKRRAGRLVAHLLPRDVQPGARKPRRDASPDAEEVLAQHARDRADPRPARRGRCAHAGDGGAGADRAAPGERHRAGASRDCRDGIRARGRPRGRRSIASAARCTSNATQTVFGEGPADAPLVFVGEQPGDQEDLAGKPFVGPAGQMFDRALAEAGIDRTRVYVTNAVKHFKFEPRGKRRIHQKPNNNEIEACRWWLDQELGLIKPQLTVALGATAARALTGRDTTISRSRGRLMTLREGVEGFITVHPSFLLRLPDAGREGSGSTRSSSPT